MNHLFVILAALLALALGAVAIRTSVRSASRRTTEWDQLLGRLAPLDRNRLARIALSSQDAENVESSPCFGDLDSELWFQEVGWQGLENVKNNCAVMIDMAHHIQSRYPEAVVLAEQLRVTARQVDWYIDRLRLASEAGHLKACFAEYGNRAIGLYYGMTESVKLIYRELGLPEQKQLEAVL